MGTSCSNSKAISEKYEEQLTNLKNQLTSANEKCDMLTSKIEEIEKNMNDNQNKKNQNINILLNSVINQNEDTLSKKKTDIFKDVNLIMKIDNIHLDKIFCLLRLKDKRIATGSADGSISVCSMDIENKKWNQDIFKENAHNGSVQYFCQLNDKRKSLVSCSNDATIKIWNVVYNSIELKKHLEGYHSSIIYQVILLSNNLFASCSKDCKIIIWEKEKPYRQHISLNDDDNDDGIYSIIESKKTNSLISSSGANYPCISFWDLNTFTYKTSIKNINYYCTSQTHMIELKNGTIVMNCSSDKKSIIFINPETYEIIKEIVEENFMLCHSSLCAIDNHSFVYIFSGNVIQISSTNYNIKFKGIFDNLNAGGFYGILPVKKGQYLITTTRGDFGLSVLEPCYREEEENEENNNLEE